MSIQKRHERPQRFTLGRATLFAVALHLLFGALVTVWPGLLAPAELAAAPEQEPLRFNFVDTPETEPPPEPPDTNVLSDIDRQAADAAEPTEAATPFSEGNTAATVVRPAAPPSEASEPTEAMTPQPEQPSEQPEARPDEAVEEASAELTEAGETVVEEAVEEAEETAEEALTTPLPPRRESLRRSLSRPQAFVDPQVHDNREGGVGGDRALAQFDTKGYDLGAYLNDVLRRIEGHWRTNMPPLIQTGVGGASFVALSIRRQRNAAGDEIAVIVAEQTWTSGQPAYDSAATFALELSNPLPPIPEFFPHEAITGRLGFIYNLDPRDVVFPDQR
jgi:hypothetical protein